MAVVVGRQPLASQAVQRIAMAVRVTGSPATATTRAGALRTVPRLRLVVDTATTPKRRSRRMAVRCSLGHQATWTGMSSTIEYSSSPVGRPPREIPRPSGGARVRQDPPDIRSDRVAGALEHDRLECLFQPGDRQAERQLAEGFGGAEVVDIRFLSQHQDVVADLAAPTSAGRSRPGGPVWLRGSLPVPICGLPTDRRTHQSPTATVGLGRRRRRLRLWPAHGPGPGPTVPPSPGGTLRCGRDRCRGAHGVAERGKHPERRRSVVGVKMIDELPTLQMQLHQSGGGGFGFAATGLTDDQAVELVSQIPHQVTTQTGSTEVHLIRRPRNTGHIERQDVRESESSTSPAPPPAATQPSTQRHRKPGRQQHLRQQLDPFPEQAGDFDVVDLEMTVTTKIDQTGKPPVAVQIRDRQAGVLAELGPDGVHLIDQGL